MRLLFIQQHLTFFIQKPFYSVTTIIMLLMPMKIVIGGRKSRKTTLCYAELEKNPNAYLLTLSNMSAHYAPAHLRNRVISYRSKAWLGKTCKFIIDEADFMDEKYLQFVPLDKIILITTSLGQSHDKIDTWLRKLVIQYGYTKLQTVIPAEILKTFATQMNPTQYCKDFAPFFKDLYKTARL